MYNVYIITYCQLLFVDICLYLVILLDFSIFFYYYFIYCVFLLISHSAFSP